MAADFSFVVAGDTPYSLDSEIAFRTRMTTLHFRPARDLVPVVFDRDRGVYDELEEEGADDSPRGWAREYEGPHCTLYVVVAGGPDYTNGYVDVSGKTFDRLLEHDRLSELLTAVGALAETIGAVGGFATFDQAFEPLPPDRMIEFIAHVPDQGATPAVMGLVSDRIASEAEVAVRFGKDYSILPWVGGYFLLKHRDLT